MATETRTVLNVRKGFSETVTIDTSAADNAQQIVDTDRTGNKGDEYRE